MFSEKAKATNGRSAKWISRSVASTGVFTLLLVVAMFVLGTSESQTAQPAIGELAEDQLMQQLLDQYRNLTYDELRKLQHSDRVYVDDLTFDPTTAKHFDLIRAKLKLTDQELELFRRNGFVSVDHRQRHSFGSAYHQIYSADLPVLITTDSILNVLHRSFDSLLMELEQYSFAPTLSELLKKCHETLATHPSRDEIPESARDVDLYLTVARNLISPAERRGRAASEQSLIRSTFGQDEQARVILDNIKQERIQVVFKDAPTEIYGGKRFIDYSQFKPRGHYTRHPSLSRYFRCMMWLSRADCGWFVLPTDEGDGIESDSIRELRNASLLSLIIEDSGCEPQFNALSKALARLVGEGDNLTVPALLALMKQQEISEVDDIAGPESISRLATEIAHGGSAKQLIRSQVLAAPPSASYTMPPPTLFQFFGQAFIIDSFVLSNVVYDSIFYNDIKMKRMMPMGLDVMAALGNDEATVLLEPELEKWRYSGNLMAATKFVENCRPEFWTDNVYNVWLDAIRDLDRDLSREEFVPEAMRTRAWQYKQLQTQLASWSELRHDTVLYAKQSFTGVPGCEYPAAYVEPYPEFFHKLKLLVESIGEAVEATNAVSPGDTSSSYLLTLRKRQKEFMLKASDILTKLEAIARKELVGESLSTKDEAFLQQTIDRRGTVGFGSGSRPHYDGWYCDLCYDELKVRKWDPTIVDVHTFPNSMGKSLALEVGIGDANFCVISVDCEDGATAYVGPVYSYYEFQQPADKRLTDKEWQHRIGADDLPGRPIWTETFRTEALQRTVDGLSLSVRNQKLRLNFCRDNESPQIKDFDASDAGVAELVQFIISEKWTDRLSFDLRAANLSGVALSDLAKLEKLTFLAIPGRGISDSDVKKFTDARPDVQLQYTPRRGSLSPLR